MFTNEELNDIKILIVGDGGVGKTSMLISYLFKKFQQDYLPTVFEAHAVQKYYKNLKFNLRLFDTAGQEDWDTLRVLAYPGTDVVILCFSLVRRDSMDNIKLQWISEVKKYLPNVPILLVGTQLDLRMTAYKSFNPIHEHIRYVTTEQADELKTIIGAFKYIECSSLINYNIDYVFDACMDSYIDYKRKLNMVERPWFSYILPCIKSQK